MRKGPTPQVLDDQGQLADEIEDKGDYCLMDCVRYRWTYLGERRGKAKRYIIPPAESR